MQKSTESWYKKKISFFSESKNLESERLQIAHELNINLKLPKQQKRIEALFLLLKKHLYKSDPQSFLHQKVIEYTNKLIETYKSQTTEIEALSKSSTNIPVQAFELETIKYKDFAKINFYEEKLTLYKQLIYANENKFFDKKVTSQENIEKIKEIEESCFVNWLKVLDINYELRNTIIGFQNRLAIYKVGNAYINYHIFAQQKIREAFEEVKEMKQSSVKEYYEILTHFSLPTEKNLNFQLFLQKKIESKLHDSLELKSACGNLIEYDYLQIQANIDEIKKQYSVNEKEIVAIINFYKTSLLKKQVIFTDECENLVKYLKERYIEKINHIFFKLDEQKPFLKNDEQKIKDEDKDLLIHLIDKEFDEQFQLIKLKYSKTLIPLMDNFWKNEKMVESKYALDQKTLNEKCIELKKSNNVNVELLVNRFKKQKEKIDEIFNNKKELVHSKEELSIKKINAAVEKLKAECRTICCNILKFNSRFWSKINAEFNSEARKYLIQLHHEYSPWINVWNGGEKAWMHDYLIINLNQEYLKAIGGSLKEFSSESTLFLEVADGLMQFNEYMRDVYKNRDLVEYENLVKLNTIPTVNIEKLAVKSNEKLQDLKAVHNEYLSVYNNFYNKIVSK